jgi:hypothetical protein
MRVSVNARSRWAVGIDSREARILENTAAVSKVSSSSAMSSFFALVDVVRRPGL